MISPDEIQRIWYLIENPSEESRIPGQILDSVTTPYGPPLLAIDGIQQRHFLMPIVGQHRFRGDQHSAGIHLLINQWGIDERQQWYVDLVCLKPHLNDIFDLIIYDICNDLPQSTAHPVDVCCQVLDQWRELLSRDNAGLPDQSTMLGLFGELYVLRELTHLHPRAIELWVGPRGARHDFSGGLISIEVKSSQQRHGRVVTIHGIDQLEAPHGGSLYLAILQVEETPIGGTALADIVQELNTLGCNRYELLRRLAQINITQETLIAINNTRFRVITTTIYHVDDSFPRITKSNFLSGQLPNGVVTVDYRIDLSLTPPHPLHPEDVMAVYQNIITTFEHTTKM